MKDVGYTQEGNRLVEMNQDEYAQFMLLNQAVQGLGHPAIYELRQYGFQQGFDFTNTFEAIRAFYASRFKINQMQDLLNDMKESLEKEDV